MLRAFSLCGLGGGFLMISPKLRQDVSHTFDYIFHNMELYAPFSYIGGAVAVLLGLAFSLYRGAQPR